MKKQLFIGLALSAALHMTAAAGMASVAPIEEDTMARTHTAGQIIERARGRADQKSWAFIEAAEALEMLSEEYGAYYDKILLHEPDQISLATPYDFTADGSDRYAMPATFYSLAGVERLVGGNQWLDLKRFQVNERNLLGQNNADAYFYRLDGNYIQLRPQAASGSYRVQYWGAPAKIENDATLIDGSGGWEGILVRELAVQMAIKEGVPATIAAHRAERDRYETELLTRFNARQPATTHVVQDVHSDDRYRRTGDWERHGVPFIDD